MINQNFIWLALAIALVGSLYYIKDTLHGNTRPNRVTFFLWGAAPLIAYYAQRSGGGGIQILYTLIIAIVPFFIFAASFVNKQAFWKITKFDVTCGVFSFIALLSLFAIGNPMLALLLSVAADFFAALPTIIKSYRYPETETTFTYAAEIASSAIVLLTIHKWAFINYFFVIYILVMNIMFTTILVMPRKRTIATLGSIDTTFKK
ncbi:MAG: hypothetical protein ABI602_01620 [Candidatus Saccharibacteria bacterium]